MSITQKILTAGLLGCFCFACGTPQPQPAAREESTPAPTIDVTKKKTFEDDLEYVRTGGFQFVFVLRRKDGGNWAAEDTASLKANSPFETNQRLLSDNGKAVIIGTNFRFRTGQWDALHKGFDVQDLSEAKYEKNENDDLPANQSPPKNQSKK